MGTLSHFLALHSLPGLFFSTNQIMSFPTTWKNISSQSPACKPSMPYNALCDTFVAPIYLSSVISCHTCHSLLTVSHPHWTVFLTLCRGSSFLPEELGLSTCLENVLKFMNSVLFFFQLIFYQPFLGVNFSTFNHGKS